MRTGHAVDNYKGTNQCCMDLSIFDPEPVRDPVRGPTFSDLQRMHFWNPEAVRDPVQDPGPGPGRSGVRATLVQTAVEARDGLYFRTSAS